MSYEENCIEAAVDDTHEFGIMVTDLIKYRSMFESNPSNPYVFENCVPIKPGDWYWAKRNGPPRILTCLLVNEDIGCYHAVQSAYPYDFNECFALKKGVDIQEVIKASDVLSTAMEKWTKHLFEVEK